MSKVSAYPAVTGSALVAADLFLVVDASGVLATKTIRYDQLQTVFVTPSGSYADPAWITSLAAAKLTGVVTVAQGGTGQATQQAALDALAGAQSAGKYLRSDGTHTALATLQAADVPVLNQSTTGTAANVTGTVAIANGGTGQVTQQAALDALTGAQSAGAYLRSDGVHAALGAIQAADVPTLNQNTTGTASNVTGTVAIIHGGTGQTTRAPAFDALSPTTTLGDLIYGSGASANSRLAGNTTATREFLRQTGDGVNSAPPAWDTLQAGDLPNHSAALLTSGTVATARLGSGVASGTTFLRGDQTWATPAGGAPGGSSGQLEYNSAGAFGGAAGTAVAASGALLTITAQADTDVPLTLKANSATQSADVVDVVASDASKILSVRRLTTVQGAAGIQVGKDADQGAGGFVEVTGSSLGFNRAGSSFIDMPSGDLTFRVTGSFTTSAVVHSLAGSQSLWTFSGWVQQKANQARVTADLTNATATFSNVADLSLTLVAGRKYTGVLRVRCSDTVAADGIKLDFNGGTATMTNFNAGVVGNVQGATAGVTVSAALATALTFTAMSGTGDHWVDIAISLVCNAAGTFIPRFAQNAHSTGTATFALGSYLWMSDSPN